MTPSGEPRPRVDANWKQPAEPLLLRVKLTTEAKPKDKFDCIVTYPKAVPEDWDPEDSGSEDADLWVESEREIKGVRYGLPSDETVEVDRIGWIHYYYGRWVLIAVEC